MPDFLLPSPEGDYDSFEAELARLQADALFDYLGGGVDDAEHVVDVAVAERVGENTTGAEAGTRLKQ